MSLHKRRLGDLGDQHIYIYKQFFPCNPPQSMQGILNVVAPLHSSALEIDSAQASSQMATLASDHALAMTNLSTKTSPKQTDSLKNALRQQQIEELYISALKCLLRPKKRPKRLQKRQAQSRRYTILASPE